MSKAPPISVGTFDGFCWIRCEGKGSFLVSPQVKEYAERCIAAGCRRVVVDLAECSGMDSTFMGTLAGLAARLSTQPEGRLQIADASERNRRSLEDLGLDFLLDINPPAAVWRGHADEARGALEPFATAGAGEDAQARHVLDAHRTLADQSQENARKFAGVIDLLESELAKPDRSRPD